MFPFVSRPRNFMNKVQRACIMFLKEAKPFMIYNYWKDACLIMFPFVSRPRNFMNKVQRACIMFMKETKPFMIKLLEGRMSDNVSICFDGPVTLWIKFKGLVSCLWKKQNRLWYNYWKDACLIMFPFVSWPRNFMNKVQRACIMFLKETKPFMI